MKMVTEHDESHHFVADDHETGLCLEDLPGHPPDQPDRKLSVYDNVHR
jgi:hypothetical protein